MMIIMIVIQQSAFYVCRLTVHFPAMEPWAAQEVVLQRVETRSGEKIVKDGKSYRRLKTVGQFDDNLLKPPPVTAMVMMMMFLLITTMTMTMIEGTSSEQHSVTLVVSAEVGRCRTLLGKLGVWYQVDIGWIFQRY